MGDAELRIRACRAQKPLGLIVAAAGLLPALVLAQSSSASYQIPRQSIDAGGGRTTSATYSLHGTLGQADAGAPMTSMSYQLRGGFHKATPGTEPIVLFRDGFEQR